MGGVGWRSTIVGIGEQGRVGNLIGVAVVGHVCRAFTMRRSSSWASLTNMLVEFGLERLPELLKILQRSGGLGAIIRCGGAKVAGLVEARVWAIRATKFLT